MLKENSSCVLFVLLFVGCMSVCDREEGCSWEEKGGVEVEKKEFFAVWVVLFCYKKMKLEVEKRIK